MNVKNEKKKQEKNPKKKLLIAPKYVRPTMSRIVTFFKSHS